MNRQLALLLLQWVPLPAPVVRLLSPQAAEVHAAAEYLGAGRLIYLSLDPHATFVFWLKSCAYALAFALTLLLVHRRRRLRWLCIAIVLSGMIQAYYGSAMHLMRQDAEVLGTEILHSSVASGSYVNRNHLAGLLEMSLAIGIGLMIAQLEDLPKRVWQQLVRPHVVDRPHDAVDVVALPRGRREVQRDVRRVGPVEQPCRQAVVLRQREPVPRRVVGHVVAVRVLAEVADQLSLQARRIAPEPEYVERVLRAIELIALKM